METILTRRARADLRAIARYIAQDNPRRAITFIEELADKCREIASMPDAFQLAEDHKTDEIRRRVHGNYLIYYIHDARAVTILQIRNASRNVTSIELDEH